MTQQLVAGKMDWSPSKILRMENGHSPVAPSDLRALLPLYGITSDEDIRALVDLARIARQASQIDRYRDILPRATIEWIEHEASAAVIRWFEINFVPGIAQTRRYALEIMDTFLPADDGEDARRRLIDRHVEARMCRADPLLAADGPEIDLIIDEATLRRGVDGVMVEQLEHLKRINTVGRTGAGERVPDGLNPRVRVQVVPASLGLYALLRGPFELLQFAGDEPSLVYLENRNSDAVIHDDATETASYFDAFLDFRDRLPPPEATNEYLDQIARTLAPPR